MSEIQSQSKLYPFHSDGLAAVLANHEHLNVSGICTLSEQDLICLNKHLNLALEDAACIFGGIQDLLDANHAAPENVRVNGQAVCRLLLAVNRGVSAPMVSLAGILSAVSGDLGYRGGYETATGDLAESGEVQP